MGANIGTTITAWLLSLDGNSGDNLFINMLKPTSFSPILAMIGIILLMSGKSDKKKITERFAWIRSADVRYVGDEGSGGAACGRAGVHEPAYHVYKIRC